MVPVAFLLLALRLLSTTVPDDVTLVLDRVLVLTVVLAVPVVVATVAGGSLNNGLLLNG